MHPHEQLLGCMHQLMGSMHDASPSADACTDEASHGNHASASGMVDGASHGINPLS